MMISLQTCKKLYAFDTQRNVPPEETLARAEKALPSAGITRVADITALDRIGIPVFSSIRPTAMPGAVSVYNGKGATPVEARVSAMMEGIERYSAEMGTELPLADYWTVSGHENAVDPADLAIPKGTDPYIPIPWVAGWDIVSNEEVLVPAHAVFHPVAAGTPRLFRTNTNGLASGNTLEEAVFHGLMELVERDAWSIAEMTRKTGPVVMEIEDQLISDLIARFTAAEVEVTVRDITRDIGIPTIAAVSDDIRLKDPALLTIGMGTHTNARIAVLRALTEVAQSRLTQIHGAREDTTTADLRRRIGYDRTKRLNRHWFSEQGTISFQQVLSCDSDDFLIDIQTVCSALARNGMPRVIVVDLTRPEIGIPVVRVIVPGLECFAMDQERCGTRCNEGSLHRLSRAKPPA